MGGKIETVPVTKSALKDYTVVYTQGSDDYQFTVRAVNITAATAQANIVLCNSRKNYEIISVTKE